MWTVEFNKADLARWMRAKDALLANVGPYSWKMQQDCAVEYIVDIMAEIGRRITPSPPYHPKYKEWKDKYGKFSTPWKLFGDLVNNLTAWREGDVWIGGVPNGIYDSGGKSWKGTGNMGPSREIVWYGSLEEERRPLFEPVRESYFNDKFPGQGIKTLKRLGDLWR